MKRNIISILCIISIFFFGPLYAEGEVLKVGIVGYNPPFAVQGANGEIFGYDVDMMNYLCKAMQRTCVFEVLKKKKLLPYVAQKKIDVAVDFTITSARLQIVNFSLPYLVSNLRFITNKQTELSKPFSLQALKNKKIGILEGSLFSDPKYEMKFKDSTIIEYDNMPHLLEDLRNKRIDFVLIHEPIANYWTANTQGEFIKEGPSFMVGYGIGIAVSKDNNALLGELNKAMLQYQDSPEYKTIYERYLSGF